MAERNIRNIFPLIDDPANIFYSKIKQWMQLQTNFHLHCKAVSRVDRVVEASFMGISRTYKTKFKTYEVLKEEDIGQYLYICYTFVASSKVTEENTSSGERIPVDIGDIYILEDSPKPFVLEGYSDNILYEEKPNTTKPCYYLYIRVDKIYKNEYSQLDIENTEIDYCELHFEDAYRKSVGRLWSIKNRPQILNTKKSILDNYVSWELYNVDSDNNYTLIDTSETIPQTFGASILWPVQYGAGLDHRAKFISCYSQSDHPFVNLGDHDFWFEVRESNWPLYKENLSGNICADLREDADPFLNTRGIVPSLFPSLFKGLSFRSFDHSSPYYPSVECVVLLLSYICNMNPRYLLCSKNEDPLKQVVNPANPNYDFTPGSLLDWTDSTNRYSMANVCTVEVDPTYSYTTISLNTSLSTTAPNYTKVKAAYDNMDQPDTTQYADKFYIGQNFLPHSIFPNVKWYLHQWVYVMSFKKYAPFHSSSNGDIYWYPPFSNIIKRYTEKFFFDTLCLDPTFVYTNIFN